MNSIAKSPTEQLIALAARTSPYRKEQERIKKLIEMGADPNAWVTPHKTILLQLMNPFHYEESIAILLAHGANPDLWRARDDREYRVGQGETPLAVACTHSVRSKVWTEAMLRAGADVNLLDSRGYTALDHVYRQLQKSEREVLNALEGQTSKLEARITVGVQYFQMGAVLECAQLLLEAGGETTTTPRAMKKIWERCAAKREENLRESHPEDDEWNEF